MPLYHGILSDPYTLIENKIFKHCGIPVEQSVGRKTELRQNIARGVVGLKISCEHCKAGHQAPVPPHCEL